MTLAEADSLVCTNNLLIVRYAAGPLYPLRSPLTHRLSHRTRFGGLAYAHDGTHEAPPSGTIGPEA